MGRRATQADLQLGIALAFSGAAVMLVSVFLPMADSSRFLHVVDNSLIQHGQGWLVVVLAIAAAASAYRTLSNESEPIWLMLVGGAALGFAIYIGSSDEVLTLSSVSQPGELGLLDELESISGTERASPGIGIYALGLGGTLTLVGGYLLRSPGDPDDEDGTA